MKSVFDFDPNLSTMPQEGRNLFWRDAKDSSAFGLYGSDALGETGYARLTEAERNVLRPNRARAFSFGFAPIPRRCSFA